MKFIFFANTDWYLYNFRLATALQVKADGHEVVMLSPPGEFGVRFAAHGLRWLTLPMDRASLNPLREAATLRQLAVILRRERPEVLHSFTVKCAIYGALAARTARVPAVVNAVADALSPFGVKVTRLPVSPARITALLKETTAQRPDGSGAWSRPMEKEAHNG